jgi:hypothetical protein
MTDDGIRELCARVVTAEPGNGFNAALAELAKAIELRSALDQEHGGKTDQDTRSRP